MEETHVLHLSNKQLNLVILTKDSVWERFDQRDCSLIDERVLPRERRLI